jgi:hypothetical protein
MEVYMVWHALLWAGSISVINHLLVSSANFHFADGVVRYGHTRMEMDGMDGSVRRWSDLPDLAQLVWDSSTCWGNRGQRVHILSEYIDGWDLCLKNSRGERCACCGVEKVAVFWMEYTQGICRSLDGWYGTVTDIRSG